LCKTTIDTKSSNSLKKVIQHINLQLADDKLNTESIYTIISHLALFNTIEIKSLILYYYHDLENRTSYIQQNEELFIKYNYGDNLHICKEDIFKHLIPVTKQLRESYEQGYSTDIQIRELFKFLYYLDNKYFLDILTLFLITVFNSHIKIANDDTVLTREIEVFRNILGI
jgi:hypothetical protein